jgi:hypothetical protein
MLTLYSFTGSCSRASHIALEESGLDFEVRLVDFATDDVLVDQLLDRPADRVLRKARGIADRARRQSVGQAERIDDDEFRPRQAVFLFDQSVDRLIELQRQKVEAKRQPTRILPELDGNKRLNAVTSGGGFAAFPQQSIQCWSP